MTDTAIFLGAGASRAEGAPLQSELFAEYFSSQHFKRSQDSMDRDLATFFWFMFQIDVDADDVATAAFPTFEEVLGLTDLAIMRGESFRGFSIENRAVNSGSLRFIAQDLVFLMARILDDRLQGRATLHRELVNTLGERDELGNIAFISTNYDILIDNALTEQHTRGLDLDYGVDFRNFDTDGDWRRPMRDRRVQLLKPHGSLNWLFCPTCNQLEITPKEKGVVTRLISHFEDSTCKRCKSVFSPLIVPPTYYKDMKNVFLSTIWNRTDVVLQEVRHVIFCGYSFPDADTHIKYLIKRAQTNRPDPLRFTVINHFPNKHESLIADEKARFTRFLGLAVDYTKLSFEDFCHDPMPIVRA